MINSVREATNSPIEILVGSFETLIDIDIVDIMNGVIKA